MAKTIKRRIYISMLRAFRKLKSNGRRPTKDIRDMKSLGANIVAIGGGTGLSTMLRGLKEYTDNITAIVTVSDDGGGSGMLREELNMLPPGDIRNCIVALANTEPTMQKLLNYRFTEGAYKGQSFGNLFLAALNGVYGSFEEAVMRMNEVLAVTGRVLPVTSSDVNLLAKFEDGSEVIGESKIAQHKKTHNCKISEVKLIPEGSQAVEDALEAIERADIIVLGPGSLYTSIIPNFLVSGITQAVQNSTALKIYVLNIMTQDGETEEYTAFDHVNSLFNHSAQGIFDVCIYNKELVSQEFIERYAKEDAKQVEMKEKEFYDAGIIPVGYDLMSDNKDFARHNPEKLAHAILREFCLRKNRDGIFGAYDRMLFSEEEMEVGE